MSQIIDMNGELAQAEYQRRMSLAQTLSQQAMSPMGGTAGGIVVPVSPIEGIGRLASALGARRQERKATEGLQQYAAQKQQRLAQTLAGLGNLTSPEEYQQAAIGMMQNPDTQPLAMELLKQSGVIRQNLSEREFTASQNQLNRDATLEAARMRANNGGAGPMSVQEYEYFKALSPEEQSRYLSMKRANPYVNLGGSQVQFDPASPGVPVSVQPVTLKPGETPEVKGQQAAAVVQAEAGAKKAITTSGIGPLLDEADAILSGKTTPTQSGAGAAMDAAGALVGYAPEGAAEADRLDAISGALVGKMPRFEGPQSDADRRYYKEMAGNLGDRKIPVARRKEALKQVRQMWAKNPEPELTPGAAPKPRRRFNPQTGELE